MPEARRPHRPAARCAARRVPIQVDGGIDHGDDRRRARCRRVALRRRLGDLRSGRSRGARTAASRRLLPDPFYERALELAERGRGKTGHRPVVGAVVVSRRRDRRRGLVRGRPRPPRRAGRARAGGGEGARRDALRHARAVLAPRPHAAVRRRRRRRPASRASSSARAIRIPSSTDAASRVSPTRGSRSSSSTTSPRGGRTRRGATWKALGRPFVTYKAAITLDGRVTVPGRRWVSGEESRRRVHELRAASDAVAVGMGTVRADAPRLDARDVGATRQPRRLAFGRGPLPEGSDLELRSGPLADELAALAAGRRPVAPPRRRPDARDGVRRGGLVDKLLLFVAPVALGRRPAFPRRPLAAPRAPPPALGAERRGRPRRGVPPRAVERAGLRGVAATGPLHCTLPTRSPSAHPRKR